MIRRIRTEEQLVSSGLTSDRALANLRTGLEFFFGAAGSAPDLAAQMEVERDRVRALRRAIADCIKADLAVFGALHGAASPGEGDCIATAFGESESLRLFLAGSATGQEGGA